MARFISVAKAAQMVGLTSRELQREIDKGAIPSVRGMIHIDDLVEIFPHARIAQADMVAWVTKIKDESLQHASEKLPHNLSKSELRERLARLTTELSYQRRKAASHEDLLQELRYSLTVLQEKSPEPNKIQSLIAWIDKHLAQ